MYLIFYIIHVKPIKQKKFNVINFIDRLNSEMPALPTEKDCMKMLHEYVTHDLFVNHRDEMEQFLIGAERSENSLRQIVKLLFIRKYVNHNQSGACGLNEEEFDMYLRKNLPQHFQAMQALAYIYDYVRCNIFS